MNLGRTKAKSRRIIFVFSLKPNEDHILRSVSNGYDASVAFPAQWSSVVLRSVSNGYNPLLQLCDWIMILYCGVYPKWVY